MSESITLFPNKKPHCQALAWLQVIKEMPNVSGGNNAPACSQKQVTASFLPLNWVFLKP